MKAKHSKAPAQALVKDIRRATRKQYSAEAKIRIVLEGLRGEDSIAELYRREGIAQGVYYKWSKDLWTEATQPCRGHGENRRANAGLSVIHLALPIATRSMIFGRKPAI